MVVNEVISLQFLVVSSQQLVGLGSAMATGRLATSPGVRGRIHLRRHVRDLRRQPDGAVSPALGVRRVRQRGKAWEIDQPWLQPRGKLG